MNLRFPTSLRWVVWNNWFIILTPTKNMGFLRQATRHEDQTLNKTQGKHHVGWDVEEEGRKQGRGKENIRKNLIKIQQNHQIRIGLGHNLIFLRQIARPNWETFPCTRKNWWDQMNSRFPTSLRQVTWNKWSTILTPTKKIGFPRRVDKTINKTQGKHHVKWEEEDEGEQQGGGKKITREYLVKR